MRTTSVRRATLSAPSHTGSVSGKWRPRSPSPTAPEHGVGQGVADGVGVAVPAQAAGAFDHDPTQHEGAVGILGEAVDVDALADAHASAPAGLVGQPALGRGQIVGRGDLEVGRDRPAPPAPGRRPPPPGRRRRWPRRCHRPRGPGGAAAARKPCGVCTATSVVRSSVAVMVCVVSTCLIVSCTGTPGTAPSTPIVGQSPQHGLEDGRGGQRAGGVVHQDHLGLRGHGGQAAAHRGRPAVPARHDQRRRRAAAASAPTASAGRTRTTPAEWGRQASTAHSRTRRPPSGENCFNWPNRRPEPPATTIDHTCAGATVGPGRPLRSGPRSGAPRPSPRPR